MICPKCSKTMTHQGQGEWLCRCGKVVYGDEPAPVMQYTKADDDAYKHQAARKGGRPRAPRREARSQIKLTSEKMPKNLTANGARDWIRKQDGLTVKAKKQLLYFYLANIRINKERRKSGFMGPLPLYPPTWGPLIGRS